MKATDPSKTPSLDRQVPQVDPAAPITFASFRLDPRAGRLLRGNEPVPLRPKTWSVLRYLSERPGVLVSKNDLLDAVWPDLAVTESVMSKSIGELRVALGDSSRKPRFIETVQRRGFRFIAEMKVSGSGSLVPGFREDQPETRDQEPGTSFFVGRSKELQRLAALFAKARAGERQVVFITGSAGIGKTALVEAFLTQLSAVSPQPSAPPNNLTTNNLATCLVARGLFRGERGDRARAGCHAGHGCAVLLGVRLRIPSRRPPACRCTGERVGRGGRGFGGGAGDPRPRLRARAVAPQGRAAAGGLWFRVSGPWFQRRPTRDQGPRTRKAQRTAERCLQRALELARASKAKSLELRAATSLARAWQARERHLRHLRIFSKEDTKMEVAGSHL